MPRVLSAALAVAAGTMACVAVGAASSHMGGIETATAIVQEARANVAAARGASDDPSRLEKLFSAARETLARARPDTHVAAAADSFWTRAYCLFADCDAFDGEFAPSAAEALPVYTVQEPALPAVELPSVVPAPVPRAAVLERSAPAVVTERVVERVVEPQYIVSSDTGMFTAMLDALEQRIKELIDARIRALPQPQPVFSGGGAAAPAFTGTYGLTQKIDTLTNTTLTNPTITGGSLSGVSVGAGDLSGVVGIDNGGTGTSTEPAYGQVLLGNVSGGYDLVATSSLGITGGGASFGQAFELVGGALTPTTSVGLIISASSTFSGGITTGNATMTSATSTNLFATLARFTTGLISSLSGTELTYTRANFENASTTRLDALQYIAVGQTSTTTIRGDGSESSFAGGITAYASSTIGNGTASGGLTVSGGATTTATSTLAGIRLTNLDCSSLGNGGTLTTDSNGNIVCAADDGGIVAGSDTQVQFNDGGSLGADAGLTYDKIADRLTVVNATATNLSVAYASSTRGVFGSLSIGSLSGILKATAGAVATALVDLASDVTGILPVAHGGTGWGAIQTNTLLTGNGTGALATTSVGTGLTLTGGALALNATGDWTGTLDGYEAAALIAAGFSTTSANYWETQQTARSADDLTNNSIEDLADVAAMSKSFGEFLSWNGSAWTNTATSSLGLPTFAHLFPGNATTTLLGFNAGLTAYASSTIGNGTAAGGLTVSGTATSSNAVITSITSSLLKTNALGQVTAAVAGTDYASPSSLFGKAWELGTNVFSQSALAPTTTQNIAVSGNGTSTFAGGLEAWRQIAAPYFHATSTNATSTFSGNVQVDGQLKVGTGSIYLNGNSTSTFSAGIQAATLNITGATSTFANGINLSTGCFSVSGTCIGAGGASLFTDGGATTYLTSSDTLGIGTTTAWAKLAVQSTYGSAPNSLFAVASSTSADGSTASTFLTVTSSGNVGIGTTTPDYKLDINPGNTAGAGLALRGGSSSLEGGELHIFDYGNTNVWAIDNYNQTIRIHRNSNVYFQFDTSTAYKPGGGSWSSVSDLRLKDIEGDYAAGLAEIEGLNPVVFRYKKDNQRHQPTDRSYVGFIAQQVAPFFPEAVSQGDDGYYTLDPWAISVASVNAIKQIASVSGLFRDRLITWLADTANGIGDLFAKRGHFEEQLCVGGTCITEPQLAALLSQSATAALADPSPIATPSATSSPPAASLVLNGNNPAEWTLNEPWSDSLGALFTNGATTETIYSTSTLDVTTAGTTTIDYWALVPDGDWLHATRSIVIGTAAFSLEAVAPSEPELPPTVTEESPPPAPTEVEATSSPTTN